MVECYPLGITVVVVYPVTMRQEEDLSSLELQLIPEGELLEILAHGVAPASRRLMVRQRSTCLEGWISFSTGIGEVLVEAVPAKVWNFLLPNSGAHQLRIEDIGTPKQRLIIDGWAVQREGCVFEGPDNSLLELRIAGDRWVLFVDGMRVEECSPGQRKGNVGGLRDLKNMPEGSYLISTEFDAGSLELNVIRKFRFFASGRLHEVRLADSDSIWQVVLDGKLIDRRAHGLKDSAGEVRFTVDLEEGLSLDASVHMGWQPFAMVWKYTLVVNGVEVPACWIKSKGDTFHGESLPVVYEASATQSAPLTLISGQQPAFGSQAAQLGTDPFFSPPEESLPQGVSFDTARGSYLANIRGRSGKFVFLGEFTTPQEAHQRYLEAVPIHCPEKSIAPSLPPCTY